MNKHIRRLVDGLQAAYVISRKYPKRNMNTEAQYLRETMKCVPYRRIFLSAAHIEPEAGDGINGKQSAVT
jgi:hypothetical protein